MPGPARTPRPRCSSTTAAPGCLPAAPTTSWPPWPRPPDPGRPRAGVHPTCPEAHRRNGDRGKPWEARSKHVVTHRRQLITVGAAEGLHRRLYPEAHSMTEDQASTVRSVVRQAIASQPYAISERVNGLLNHVGEPGYKARLVDLATAADAAVPGVVGTITAWANAVYKARNE